jgi:phosphohistidine swiveling domain-containing protein
MAESDNSPQPCILAIAGVTTEPVGGKAHGLAELTRMGLPVPPAFVIQHASASRYPDNLEQHYHAIGGGLVAVRSSALGEDGEESSFAGQYETILNVNGMDELRAAITRCVESLGSARATAYQGKQGAGMPEMCVVVQRMVNARAAGVLFTADPVSGRHDRLVIDAVEGLGEALVSGEATPDHFLLDRDNRVVFTDLAGTVQVITAAEIAALATQAREASRRIGAPIDMEWAIDRDGSLFWLQARPITTLPSDLNEFDTPIPATDVITRGNVGENMPGAVCPLTFFVQGRAIEEGMQHMHVEYGGRKAVTGDWTQMNYFFGYWFYNMTQGLAAARYVSLNSSEAIGRSILGRPVPELKEPENKANFLRRLWGSIQFFHYCYRAPTVLNDFEQRLKHIHLRYSEDPVAMEAELARNFHWLVEANQTQVRTTSATSVMEGIVQAVVSRGKKESTPEEQAEAARLLAGAENVESALLVEHLDEVLDQIAQHPDVEARFCKAPVADALAWLQDPAIGAASLRFRDFLRHHGHRCYRELCLRERGWADEPEKLVASMQATIATRFLPGYRPHHHQHLDLASLGFLLQKLLPVTHSAIRMRERNKSLLVETTHRIKRGYRFLGELLHRKGLLPDADLVFFLSRIELAAFVKKPDAALLPKLQARRKALEFQGKLDFRELYVGAPEPVAWEPVLAGSDRELVGRPVSRGIVAGLARVAMTVEEAAELKPGEILIAPITDVGWTPYFSLIAGLATDVGSAVSHGAVIAREYGLPAVVNLRVATRVFKTGDRVRLDADKGLLTRLDS